MAAGQAFIASTAANLRKALNRTPYDPDSESEIDQPTNRGHKDKKRARYVSRGRLAPPTGLENEIIEYGGERREIICRRPKLVDEDGYSIDSDEESDDERVQEAAASAAQFYPYADIHIERILAPLTTVTDLPTHPTLSLPFTSTTLTELALQSSAIMRKENQSLWQTKRLMTRLCGDFDFAPSGLFVDREGEDPLAIDFPPPQQPSRASRSPRSDPAASVNGHAANGLLLLVNGARASHGGRDDAAYGNGDAVMGEADADADAAGSRTETETREGSRRELEGRAEAATNGGGSSRRRQRPQEDPSRMDVDVADGNTETASRLNGAGSPPPPPPDEPADTSLPAIEGLAALVHPLFRMPPNAHPDRDLGLPDQEAEDLRRLLALWVQKQEEVCRGVARLNDGLLFADRKRKDVLRWAKAEAHCGANRDMSDGEDWYDKEEWGLVEDLKKGEDGEEEEATAGPANKKTRARK